MKIVGLPITIQHPRRFQRQPTRVLVDFGNGGDTVNSVSSIWRVPIDLQLFPNRIQMKFRLTKIDMEIRVAMCRWFSQKIEWCPVFRWNSCHLQELDELGKQKPMSLIAFCNRNIARNGSPSRIIATLDDFFFLDDRSNAVTVKNNDTFHYFSSSEESSMSMMIWMKKTNCSNRMVLLILLMLP